MIYPGTEAITFETDAERASAAFNWLDVVSIADEHQTDEQVVATDRLEGFLLREIGSRLAGNDGFYIRLLSSFEAEAMQHQGDADLISDEEERRAIRQIQFKGLVDMVTSVLRDKF